MPDDGSGPRLGPDLVAPVAAGEIAKYHLNQAPPLPLPTITWLENDVGYWVNQLGDRHYVVRIDLNARYASHSPTKEGHSTFKPQRQSAVKKLAIRLLKGFTAAEMASINALPPHQHVIADFILANCNATRRAIDGDSANRSNYRRDMKRYHSPSIRTRLTHLKIALTDIFVYAKSTLRRGIIDYDYYTDAHQIESLLQGQRPRIFAEICSDSRIIFPRQKVGRVFGPHGNAGGEIIQMLGEDEQGRTILGLTESYGKDLGYALRHAGSKDVLVTSHGECGGSKAAMDQIHESLGPATNPAVTELKMMSYRLRFLPRFVEQHKDHFIAMVSSPDIGKQQQRYLAGEIAMGVLKHHVVSRIVGVINAEQHEESQHNGNTWVPAQVHYAHIGLRPETGVYVPHIFQPTGLDRPLEGFMARLATRFENGWRASRPAPRYRNPTCSCGHH